MSQDTRQVGVTASKVQSSEDRMCVRSGVHVWRVTAHACGGTDIHAPLHLEQGSWCRAGFWALTRRDLRVEGP